MRLGKGTRARGARPLPRRGGLARFYFGFRMILSRAA